MKRDGHGFYKSVSPFFHSGNRYFLSCSSPAIDASCVRVSTKDASWIIWLRIIYLFFDVCVLLSIHVARPSSWNRKAAAAGLRRRPPSHSGWEAAAPERQPSNNRRRKSRPTKSPKWISRKRANPASLLGNFPICIFKNKNSVSFSFSPFRLLPLPSPLLILPDFKKTKKRKNRKTFSHYVNGRQLSSSRTAVFVVEDDDGSSSGAEVKTTVSLRYPLWMTVVKPNQTNQLEFTKKTDEKNQNTFFFPLQFDGRHTLAP